MFDIGFWEVLILATLGLLILGPERLPRVLNKVGRWVGAARRTANQLRWQIERELEMTERADRNHGSGKKSAKKNVIHPVHSTDAAQRDSNTAAQGTPGDGAADTPSTDTPSTGTQGADTSSADTPATDRPAADARAATDGTTKAGHPAGTDDDESPASHTGPRAASAGAAGTTAGEHAAPGPARGHASVADGDSRRQ